ncbi:MAG: phage baseplate assembly protein V [Pseudomonadota bacterium]|nr:phage baseplate assembly protein V [Pseudomonadota bacterium]
MIRDLQLRIDRALARVRQAFRGVVKTVNSAPAVQLVQVDGLDGETLQAAELMQHYGLTSNPPAGTMAVLLPIGGRTAHGIVIATEHGAYRLKGLASGEVALYTDEGDHIHLKRGRVVEINTQTLIVNASAQITLNSPLVRVTGGELKVDLGITEHQATIPKTLAGMRTIYNAHTHTDPQGGSVSTPIGTM